MDQLTRANIEQWNDVTARLLALQRAGPIGPLPVLYRQLGGRGSGPVLSLVCGRGVRGIQFARAGFDVTCVDLSPHMIAHARKLLGEENEAIRRRVELRCADARVPAGRAKFGLVVLDDWDFAQMLTQDDQLACLRSIREAMLPEGRAVIDTFSPYFKIWRDKVLSGEPRVSETKCDGGRALVRRTTRSEFDHLTQIETMHVKFEVLEGGKATLDHQCTWKLRHTSLWEFELLLKVSGLRPVVRCPDFLFERTMEQQPPFDHATDDFAFIVTKTPA